MSHVPDMVDEDSGSISSRFVTNLIEGVKNNQEKVSVEESRAMFR